MWGGPEVDRVRKFVFTNNLFSKYLFENNTIYPKKICENSKFRKIGNLLNHGLNLLHYIQ